MTGTRSQRISLVFGALLFAFSSAHVLAQLDDPDPNSPTPVLLSQESSIRALAAPAGRATARSLGTQRTTVFQPGSTIELFVTNISLMDGEGYNAFRVYGEDAKGHKYRFPVVGMRSMEPDGAVYALKVDLSDEIRYWDSPRPSDMLVYATWRGLASNTVILGYGATGGGVKAPEGSSPTPLSMLGKFPTRTAQNLAPEAVGYRWSGDRARFLQQAAFGLTPDLDFRIRRIGLRTWLAEQFEAAYPSAANPYPNIPLKNTDASNTSSES
jgi:hypothetical protein